VSPAAGEYALVFLTGLLGSAHCIGMCGGFVLMYSTRGGQAQATRWPAHILYNSGRILTYSIVGGLMGYAGSFVETAAEIRGIQGAALLLAGTLMVGMGLNLIGLLGRPGSLDSPGITSTRPFRRAFLSLMQGGPLSTFPLGMLLGLVPCGLSYTMEIKAASAGGFVQGFFLMAAFGLGTAPAMLALGRLSSVLTARFRSRAYRAAAAAVILLGIQSLLRGLAFNGIIDHNGLLW